MVWIKNCHCCSCKWWSTRNEMIIGLLNPREINISIVINIIGSLEKKYKSVLFASNMFILWYIRYNVYIFSAFCCFAYHQSSSIEKSKMSKSATSASNNVQAKILWKFFLKHFCKKSYFGQNWFVLCIFRVMLKFLTRTCNTRFTIKFAYPH